MTREVRRQGDRVARWDPFLDSFRMTERLGARFREEWPAAASDGSDSLLPRADLFDDSDGVTIEVELPGIVPGQVTVCVCDGTIAVEAERSFVRNGRNVMHLETPYGRMRRTFQLPVRSLPAQAVAEMRLGILRIFVPRVRQNHTETVQLQTRGDCAATHIPVHQAETDLGTH